MQHNFTVYSFDYLKFTFFHIFYPHISHSYVIETLFASPLRQVILMPINRSVGQLLKVKKQSPQAPSRPMFTFL